MTVMKLSDPALLKQQALIDGQWAGAERMLAVHNPADGTLIGHVPDMGAMETRVAITAAERAFAAWRGRTADERSRVLRAWFELMIEHREDLAMLMTCEQGKPLAEARGEIGYAASYIEWFAEEARRVSGEVIASPWPDRRIVVLSEPVGVCAAITPWNFPAAMITRKAAAALAVGCTMIVKPASQTPLSALALGELALRAGVPSGVLSVITGGARAIGGELTSNPAVRKLSFTGSTEVGRLLAAQCAPTLKKMSLELGGNAPLIVFEDADLDAAVAGTMVSKFRNSGQTCVCTNRVLVHEAVYDAFADKLAAAASALRVGDGLEPGVEQGPLIDLPALEKVEALVGDASQQGARVLTGGRRHRLGGTFYEPTVIAGATPRMRLAHEEVFGPVAPLFRFSSEDEAVRLANDTEFGLAAYFYSSDTRRVWRVASALQCGMVGINTGQISTAAAPFGGVKQSGMGREGSHYGIREYVETKYLCIA